MGLTYYTDVQALFLFGCHIFLDGFGEFHPVFFGHATAGEHTHAGSAALERGDSGFADFAWQQARAFGVGHLVLVAPVVANEQAAVYRSALVGNALNLFGSHFAHPCRRFKIEVVVVHWEHSIDVPVVPLLTNHPHGVAVGTREHVGAHLLAHLVNSVANLVDDISLSLAPEGVRIEAPIPGKSAIGIEVPNKKPQIVSMEAILNTKKFKESKMELPIAIGKTISNDVYMFDLHKLPHLLVAGATGQGKSVGLNAIISSLLYKKHPNELKFVLVDPKKVEFSIYRKIADHYMAALPENEDEPIITDVQKVVRTLKSLCELMDHRYDLLQMAQVRKIEEYNEKFINHKLDPTKGHAYMPYIVVIIDEFGDLIMTAGKEIELPIARIAQLARAVGIHMVIATQRPTTKIITGNIKANFPGRIAFRVTSVTDSRTILDRKGAEQLVGRGDMLFLSGGDPVRIQCAFIDTPEIESICDFISQQPGPVCPFELPEPKDDSEEGGNGGTADIQSLDPLFEEAAHAVVLSQQGSTSMIQRRFAIGYNRAGRVMDQLQKAGIVGAAQGSKPRDVLIADDSQLDKLLLSLRS